MIRCAPDVIAAIAEHARRDAPRECCGLLVGGNGCIDRAEAAANSAADPTRRYEIDPLQILAAMKRYRGTPRGVVGAYHSHPRSSPEPSETDRAEAFPEFFYLIAGPVIDGCPVDVRAFRLENGNFRRIEIVPDAREPGT